MYAEAQNEASGPDQSVYDALNKIRDRDGMPDIPACLTQSATDALINRGLIEFASTLEKLKTKAAKWKQPS